MTLVVRCAATLSYLVAIVYSTVFLKRHRRPSYFKCAFYGLLPLCLSGLYALAMMAGDVPTTGFSLSVLGEVSAYLFVNAANRSLIPKEEAEQQQYISVPGLVVAAALLLILLVPAAAHFSVSALLTAALYALAMCPCLYTCVDICRNPYKNPFKAGIRQFNGLVILHIAATALFPLGELAGTALVLLCGVAWTVSGLGGMFLLKKGLEPWEI